MQQSPCGQTKEASTKDQHASAKTQHSQKNEKRIEMSLICGSPARCSVLLRVPRPSVHLLGAGVRVAFVVFGCSAPLHTSPQGHHRRGLDQDCKGRAGSVGVESVVWPLKMATLLLSVHPLLDLQGQGPGPVPAPLQPPHRGCWPPAPAMVALSLEPEPLHLLVY